jgi:2-oxo-4-hydroxy-4-carboxy-5-ureidoimidazoline decarboxylase
MEMQNVNRMDQVEFVDAFGGIFEHSRWVAENAFAALPFGSLDALHGAMVAAVMAAPRERQIALLCAHPDLAGKEAQEGSMTDASVAEQSSAGLDRLTRAEMTRLNELNAAYRARHGFPFIIAVRHYTKEGVLHEFARRLERDSETEIAACLQQVFAITRMRLARLIDDRACAPLTSPA